MLPYGLAIAVGLSSSILFLIAFLMPKIHRQDDFFWSGLGFFYALVLWFCAPQLKGAILLGQVAAAALLISYSWQVIALRKAIIDPSQQQNLDGFSILGFIGGFFNRAPKVAESKPEAVEKVGGVEAVKEAGKVEKVEEVSQTSIETQEENVPIAAVTEDNVVNEMVDKILETPEETTAETTELKDDTVIQSQDNSVIQTEESTSSTANQDVPRETATEVDSEPESTMTSSISEKIDKKPGLFNKLLDFGNKEPQSSPPNISPDNTPSLTNTKLSDLLDEDGAEETKSEEKPDAISEVDTAVSTEATVTEVEEETNWDFLDEEPETTPEATAIKEEDLVPESITKSTEETGEPTTSVDQEEDLVPESITKSTEGTSEPTTSVDQEEDLVPESVSKSTEETGEPTTSVDQEEDLAPESVNKSTGETGEPTTSVDQEKPSPNQELN